MTALQVRLHMERKALPHTVYRAFDAAGRLLYVGCTFDFERRRKEHRNKVWYPLVERWTTCEFPTFRTARDAEAEAIRSEGPLYTPVPNGPRKWPMAAEAKAS